MVAVVVDGDMVVVPTQGCKIVRVVGAAVRNSRDVVGFKTISAHTAVYDTCPVTIRH